MIKSNSRNDGLPAALACLLWSTAFVGIKAGYSAGAEPFFFAGIRFFASGLLLIPIVLLTEGRKSIVSALKDHSGFVILIGLLQTFVMYGAFYTGVGLIPASVAAIIIGAQPLLTSAAAHAFPPRERLIPRQWFSLLLGFLGLVILSVSRYPPGGSQQGSGELFGILFMLLALVSSTASNIWISRTRRKIQPLTLSSGQFLVGGALLLILSIPIEGKPDINTNLKFWLALVWLVMVSSTGISIWFALLRKAGSRAGALSVWKFIIPVAGAGFGWLLIPGDSPSAGSIAGMLLIGISVVFYFR